MEQQTPPLQAPRSILIIRLSAIGDNVMATPLIQAFRRKFPEVSIDWLVQPESIELIAHHPELREAIAWPTRDFRKLAKKRRYFTLVRTWWQAAMQIRKKRYDWVIDTQGLLKSGLVAWLSGAPYRVGLGAREGAQYLVHANVPKIHGHPRISSEYMDLAGFLGLPMDHFHMKLCLSVSACDAASGVIEAFKLQNGFVVICPFTTRPQKHWIFDHWIRWIDLWWAQTGIPCVMLGGPGDREAADQIQYGVKQPASLFSLAGARFLSIPDAAALIGRSRLLVGVDTGMTHMGIALRRPTVCLFGSTVPYTETETEGVTVLHISMDCAPCRKHPTCDGAFHCMRQLTPERVLEAAIASITDKV